MEKIGSCQAAAVSIHNPCFSGNLRVSALRLVSYAMSQEVLIVMAYLE